MSVYFELRGKFFLTLWIQTFEVQADGLGAVIGRNTHFSSPGTDLTAEQTQLCRTESVLPLTWLSPSNHLFGSYHAKSTDPCPWIKDIIRGEAYVYRRMKIPSSRSQ